METDKKEVLPYDSTTMVDSWYSYDRYYL